MGCGCPFGGVSRTPPTPHGQGLGVLLLFTGRAFGDRRLHVPFHTEHDPRASTCPHSRAFMPHVWGVRGSGDPVGPCMG